MSESRGPISTPRQDALNDTAAFGGYFEDDGDRSGGQVDTSDVQIRRVEETAGRAAGNVSQLQRRKHTARRSQSESDSDGEGTAEHGESQNPTNTSFRQVRPARSVVSSDFLDEDEDHEEMGCRQRVNLLFSNPTSSILARFITIFFMMLIMLSTTTFLLETVPELSADPDFGDPGRECMWFVIESVFIAFFTFEYAIRWATEPMETICSFPFEPFNIVDLIAIAPYYLEVVANGGTSPCATSQSGSDESTGIGLDLRFIRVVRLARVFRVMKLGRNLNATKVLTQTFSRSRDALMVPFFFLLLGMIVFSSLIYLVEQGNFNQEDGRYYITDSQGHEAESSYESIPDTLWWAIVTMTTVGYGDMTPKTGLGKAINSMAMMFGVLFFAMPIAIVGAEFTVAWDDQNKLKEDEKAKRTPFPGAQRELQSNTKAWGNEELNFFNIAFSERNLTLEQFLGYNESATECRLEINTRGWFKNTGIDVSTDDTLGLLFKFESVQHKGMPKGSADEGIVLHKVEAGNPVVRNTAVANLVGRRLTGIKLGQGADFRDFTSREVLEEWVVRHPRGDDGSWADSLHKKFGSLAFQFETEQQSGDRIMRYAPPESLVPEHFNPTIFHTSARRIYKDLTVPRTLSVTSECDDLGGVYELQTATHNKHFKWVRRDDRSEAAEPRTARSRGQHQRAIVSEDGRWAVQKLVSSGGGASSVFRPGGDDGLRTQEVHRGNLPDRKFVWEKLSETPRRRWVSATSAVREVPSELTVDTEDAHHLCGTYEVTPELCNHHPKWVRQRASRNGSQGIIYFRSEGHVGRWIVEQRKVTEDGEVLVLGAALRSGEISHKDKTPDRAHGWQNCDGPNAGWSLCQDYDRVAWKHNLGKTRVTESNAGRPPTDSLLNLAHKVFHVQRAQRQLEDANLSEKNIAMYTKDLVAQLFHHVGLARLPTGFRSRAGLKVYFGSPETHDKPREFHSDSDLGLFGIAPGKVVPVYCVANQALLPSEKEKKGRIAGELLAVAQSFWLLNQKRTGFDLPVYLCTFRGTQVRFYSAVFNTDYLECISAGRPPDDGNQVRVMSFPNRKDADADGQRRYDCIRRTEDDVFADTRRDHVDLETTALEWKMYPQQELLDGKLQYVSMPRIEDYGGSSPLRVVGVNRSYHAGVKVGMRLLRIEDLGRKVTVNPTCKADYDRFIRERAKQDQLETILVRATVVEEYDSLDLMKSAERAVVIEMLQRLRVRIMRYLHDELSEEYVFRPGHRAQLSCKSHRFDDDYDPDARQKSTVAQEDLPRFRSRGRSLVARLGGFPKRSRTESRMGKSSSVDFPPPQRTGSKVSMSSRSVQPNSPLGVPGAQSDALSGGGDDEMSRMRRELKELRALVALGKSGVESRCSDGEEAPPTTRMDRQPSLALPPPPPPRRRRASTTDEGTAGHGVGAPHAPGPAPSALVPPPPADARSPHPLRRVSHDDSDSSDHD